MESFIQVERVFYLKEILKAELFPLKTQMEIQFHMNMIIMEILVKQQRRKGIQADLPII